LFNGIRYTHPTAHAIGSWAAIIALAIAAGSGGAAIIGLTIATRAAISLAIPRGAALITVAVITGATRIRASLFSAAIISWCGGGR
jgi:hypothetical protein